MSEMSQKVRNNRSYFSDKKDFTNDLVSYFVNKANQINAAIPVSKENFLYGGKSGIPLYYDSENKKIYVEHRDRHSIIIGATASKKSRLVAMPSVLLLAAGQESMIICDPKAEIYMKTRKYLREHNYNIQVLNLREPQKGAAWNPLYIPYLLYQEGQIDRAYEFANDIAVNLTNIDKSQKEVFWDNSAGSFFFGLILLLFKYCKEFNKAIETVNIGNIIRLRNLLCAGTTLEIRCNPLWKYAQKDSFISSILIGTVETATETRAGILSTFDQKMRAFSIQPSLLGMLSHNNIAYESLRGEPTAIFLILPDEKTGYHGLASLFIKQTYEYLIFQAQNKLYSGESMGIRINYILDEFSAMPTIADFPAMITAARSRNISFNLFLQSRHQLKLRYGEEAETILANCENWLFLTSREIELLKEISELCGTGNSNKQLLSVPELQRLNKQEGEVLILSGRNKPFISNLADIDEWKISTDENIFQEMFHYEMYETDFQEIFMQMEEQPGLANLASSYQKNMKVLTSLSDEEIERLIADIDQKLKELDKEEKNTKKV